MAMDGSTVVAEFICLSVLLIYSFLLYGVECEGDFWIQKQIFVDLYVKEKHSKKEWTSEELASPTKYISLSFSLLLKFHNIYCLKYSLVLITCTRHGKN